MRKMIVTAALLAVTSAQAAEELKFGDINYLFKQGELNALANVNVSYLKENNQGTVEETRGYITETQLTYGLSDKLNAFLGVNYAYDLQKEIAGNPDINSDGFANPILGAIYRLANQSESSYNIDFGAIARFNIEDAQKGASAPGVSEDGNFADGRSSLELLARMGRKWNEANEWQLSGGLVYHKDGEVTNMATSGADVDEDIDSSTDVYLKAAYQYRPINEMMFLLSAQATRFGAVDSELNDGTDIEKEDHIDWDFAFVAKYLITENFIAKFNYGMSRNSDVDVTTAGSHDKIQSRRENYYGLGVDFLF